MFYVNNDFSKQVTISPVVGYNLSVERSAAELQGEPVDKIARRLIAYAQRLQEEGDKLVKLANHAKYCNLTYASCTG